jgi:hypothetical protein
MKDLVQFLAQQLVNNPDAVEVKETQGDTASVLELRVAKEDLRFAHQSQSGARNYRRQVGRKEASAPQSYG